jgi:rSAM/selenodomain-associated transferase 1
VTRDSALVLYARAPRPGTVKTRMIPWLDSAEALGLHLALLEDGLRLLRIAAAAAGAVPFLSLTEPWAPERVEGSAGLSEASLGIARLLQNGRSLGDRLLDTCRALFARGFHQVSIIGSDSPTLPVEIVTGAFSALRRGADAVLGPAEDGGYCLVGASRLLPGMFEGIPWGTARVFEATRAALEGLGARLEVLPPWYDIDLPRDLDRLRSELPDAAGGGVPLRTRTFVERLVREGRLPLPATPPGGA